MWLLPSFGRPKAIERLRETLAQAPITLWLTADDPKLDEYPRVLPVGWQRVIGPAGLRLAPILNEAFKRAPEERFYGFLGDDVDPWPEDSWWRQLESAAVDGMAVPVDTIWGIRGAPHFCLDGDLVRKVGYLALPGTRHSFFDTAWFALMQQAGRVHPVPSVWFRHNHPLATGQNLDDTYSRGQESYQTDEAAFRAWVHSGRFKKDLVRLGKTVEDGLVLRAAG